jgi:hypothetical protein
MNSQIANEQLVIEAKNYIYKYLSDVGKPGYFINGVDTNSLNKIYLNINTSNVNELYQEATMIISTHLNKAHRNFNMSFFYASGSIFVVGLGVMGISYILNKLQYNKYSDLSYKIGGTLCIIGICSVCAIGH